MALASIVEKEARLPEERPVIAAVYTTGCARRCCCRRIRRCSTRSAGIATRVFYKDLEIESPYNTYSTRGCRRGRSRRRGRRASRRRSIPAAVPYLYFVACPDGHHEFRSTFRAHTEAVQEARRERREHASRE